VARWAQRRSGGRQLRDAACARSPSYVALHRRRADFVIEPDGGDIVTAIIRRAQRSDDGYDSHFAVPEWQAGLDAALLIFGGVWLADASVGGTMTRKQRENGLLCDQPLSRLAYQRRSVAFDESVKASSCSFRLVR
jgi:hypothetical protein